MEMLKAYKDFEKALEDYLVSGIHPQKSPTPKEQFDRYYTQLNGQSEKT